MILESKVKGIYRNSPDDTHACASGQELTTAHRTSPAIIPARDEN
jgi:hypothetical protein